MGTVIRLENEMKDSGIDWYGLMPANWEIKPIYASLDEINQKIIRLLLQIFFR